MTLFGDWMRVSRQWVYLEPIYTQADVRASLKVQSQVFDKVTKSYGAQMSRIAGGLTTCQEFCRVEGFAGISSWMLADLEQLDKSLCAYLDQKRTKFSRFYFTSNEDLIELMGHLSDQDYLQKFIGKLFEGVTGLKF